MSTAEALGGNDGSGYVGQNRGHRLAIVQQLVVAFLFWVALYLYVPTLPTYVAGKSQNLAMVGVVLSMYGLFQTIIRVPLGIASDWSGWRKPFVIGGLALTGLGAWIMGAADSVHGLMLGRAATGLAVGTWAVMIVAFSGLFRPREAVKASTMLAVPCSIGCLLASMATGPLTELGGARLPFKVAAVAAGLGLLVALPLREKRHEPQSPSARNIGRLLTQRSVLTPTLLNAVLTYAVYVTSFGFLPILAKQLGATAITLSILMSVYLAMSTLGALLAAAAARRGQDWLLARMSFFLLLVAIGGMTLARSLLWLGVSQGFMGLSFGTGYSVFMGLSIKQVADTTRATAMGIHQAVCGIGMFAGSWLGGVLADGVGIRRTFVVTGLGCFVLVLLVNYLLGWSDKGSPVRRVAS